MVPERSHLFLVSVTKNMELFSGTNRNGNFIKTVAWMDNKRQPYLGDASVVKMDFTKKSLYSIFAQNGVKTRQFSRFDDFFMI